MFNHTMIIDIIMFYHDRVWFIIPKYVGQPVKTPVTHAKLRHLQRKVCMNVFLHDAHKCSFCFISLLLVCALACCET